MLIAVVPPLQAEVVEAFQELAQSEAREFRYRETRRLELLAEPWQGSGFVYSGSSGTLVKLQIVPTRIVQAVQADRLYHYDSTTQQRFATTLAAAGEAARPIQVFRALLQGRREELTTLFNVKDSHDGADTRLRLTPRSSDGRGLSEIVLTGDRRSGGRVAQFLQADGDSTEIVLEPGRAGEAVEESIRQLLYEATGDRQ